MVHAEVQNRSLVICCMACVATSTGNVVHLLPTVEWVGKSDLAFTKDYVQTDSIQPI